MKELQDIIVAFESLTRAGNTTAALATLVKVEGSAYRRPGARLLVTQRGLTVGAISGGCLEADILERAQEVMHSGQPTVVTYDTTTEEDIVWGLGLGCNGVVHVLIERLELKSFPSPIAFLQKCLGDKQRGVLATVFGVKGQGNVKVGAHLMLNSSGIVACDIEEPTLTLDILTDVQAALRNERSSVKTYPFLSGHVEVLIEVIEPPTSLMIFGAGHDAFPVAGFAQALGWDVTIVDTRANQVTLERFRMANRVILTRLETARERVLVNEHTVAVVMTHNYLHDLELVKMLLPSPVHYLGILGPKDRAQRLLQDLCTEGIVYTEKQLQRLFGPVGLDIGADTPEAIALAIIAEIQAVIANRSGGSLRNRLEPIHHRLNDPSVQTGLFDRQHVGV